MARQDPRSKLNELHEAAELISANLVELEIDSSRRLLDSHVLEGESAARWAAASTALTELWRRQGLLEALLREADKLRGSRRSGQLAELLDGQSIELTNTDVPIAERNLLGNSIAATRCSPDELLTGMSALFDDVRAVIAQISNAWEISMPKLDAARRLLDDAVRVSADVGSSRAEIESASERLSQLSASVATDPLSTQPDEIDRLEADLATLRDELERSAELRRGFEAAILDARGLMNRIRTAIDEATTAHDEVLTKILTPTVPAVPDADARLEQELTPIALLAEAERWREARRALDHWTESATTQLREVCHARDANRAPIEARNQFRALLEAYQVKAKRVGRLEDPELERIFRRARDVLYTAPTDLGLAAQLVRSYQQALSAPTPTAEVIR
jgi:hypothetical protein